MYRSHSATLEACDPTGKLNLFHELGAIKEDSAFGLSSSRAYSNDTSWTIWGDFCISLSCDPLLLDIDDPMPLLQIFAA
jgi:hypothetical protein